MATIVAVGVDNGGTWIRMKGLDVKGRCVWSLKKPSPSVDDLPRFLKKSLSPLQGKLPALAVGSRGVWKKNKRRLLRRALQGLAKTIVVMSDVEAAWGAAFKTEGILVIAGTGSIAYGKRRNGTFARTGGLGPEKGDEGSGYWIGREWKGHTRSVRHVAQRAPLVIKKAAQGNAAAGEIIHQAQNHLADLVVQLMREMSWKGIIPLSTSGSVLENAWFNRGFRRALRRKKIRFNWVKKRLDAATALALFPQSSICKRQSAMNVRLHS